MAEKKLPKGSSKKSPSPSSKGGASPSKKRRSTSSRTRRKKGSQAFPIFIAAFMGFLVALLLVGGFFVFKKHRTSPAPKVATMADFHPSPKIRVIMGRVHALVKSLQREMGDKVVTLVDSSSYYQCTDSRCWSVETATYITDLAPTKILSELRRSLRTTQGLEDVKIESSSFQWLRGEGLAVSFLFKGQLVGRYTFVEIEKDEDREEALQFKPFLEPNLSQHPGKEPPMVAIVIDDVGYTKQAADLFLGLPFPITVSIIPFTPFVHYAIEKAKRSGKEVMLHIPMESGGHREAIERMESRTKGMLRVSMSDAEILAMLRREIAAVPGAIGANNHMGSKFTCNRHKMKVVLKELNRHGLFFLDSLTSSRSVAYRVAREMGMPALRRDVFLDHSHTKKAMNRQFKRLAAIALKRGYAVAIGHPLLPTYTMIKEGASKLREMGIEIVPISRLLKRVEGAKNGRSGFQKARELNQ